MFVCLCVCVFGVCVYDSNTFFTGSKCGRAVGSQLTLHAVGQGDYGGQSPLCRAPP